MPSYSLKGRNLLTIYSAPFVFAGKITPFKNNMSTNNTDTEIDTEDSEPLDLPDAIDTYIKQNDLHTMNGGGEAGVRDFSEILTVLGYNEDGFKYGTLVEKFLCDNPGAIECLIQWIGEQDSKVCEWRDKINDSLLSAEDYAEKKEYEDNLRKEARKRWIVD